ncbi:MAG: DNRLRE domain-containing protein [Candidatus Aegiribacteria sp.]|nr:DNRLRE domain-containing protein [Candidatus Aegiribacteria sp.]
MLKYSVVTIALMLTVSSVALATVAVVYPSDDSFVWRFAPNNNYGSYNEATIGKDALELIWEFWARLFSRYRFNYEHMWTALRFDVTPYSGITLDSAKVAVYIYKTRGTFPPNEVWVAKCSGNWDENEITWNNRPNYHDWHVPPAPEYAWWTIDVTTWAQKWIDGAYPNYGIWIGTNATGRDYFDIYTKETIGTIADPQLILYYTEGSVELTFPILEGVFVRILRNSSLLYR